MTPATQIRHAHYAGPETRPTRGGADPDCKIPAPHECRDDQGRPLEFIDGELAFGSWCEEWAKR